MFLTLLVSACSKKPDVPAVDPFAPHAHAAPTSSDCWSQSIKSTAQGLFEDEYSSFFDEMKGQNAGVDEVAASPKTIVLNQFAVRNFDEKSGHSVCTVSISAAIESKRYGTIVVPEEYADFDILQAENGQQLNVSDAQMKSFWYAVYDQLQKHGIAVKLNISDDTQKNNSLEWGDE